jgi:S-DNA-T family DNA segregation ATPase FtsK/SpoIIIE
METLVATAPVGTIGGHPRDALLEQAKELAKQHNDVSTSFLQRRLHIGYPRAARLKEQLDAALAQEGEDIPDSDEPKENEY